MTGDKMVGWHHRLNGLEFEQAPGDSEGQGSLVCCSTWGCKESDTTEQLNNNRNEFLSIKSFINTKINGLPKVQCLVNMVNKSKVPNQAVILPGHQRNMGSCVILTEDYALSVD